jgi:hypothetical protein
LNLPTSVYLRWSTKNPDSSAGHTGSTPQKLRGWEKPCDNCRDIGDSLGYRLLDPVRHIWKFPKMGVPPKKTIHVK